MSYQEQGGGSESVVVNGTVEGVEIKPNGRYVVKVREFGSTGQYALNLNTKEQGLAQQLMNAIGQQFSFVCGLSHWTNQSGQPVTSKWINGVAPFQPGMQAQPQQPPMTQSHQAQPQWGTQQQQQAVATGQPQWTGQGQQQAPPPAPPQRQEATDDAFIRRVSWLAAVPAAVAALTYLPEEQQTVPALVKMADFLAQTAILRGQQGFGQATTPPVVSQPPEQGGYDEYGTPPPGDDDLPF